jgi:hypothetical protein
MDQQYHLDLLNERNRLQGELIEVKADIKTSVDLIKKLLTDVGLMVDGEMIIKTDPETGEVNVPFTKIMKTISKLALSRGSMGEKFAYMSELGPVLEKYKELQ